MAKKRQLNVRLSDALLSQLEDRVQKTKMGMAAMVEVLLVQALQHQEASDSSSAQSDRLDSLEKRIEALESRFAISSTDSQEVEISDSAVIDSPVIDSPVTESDAEHSISNGAGFFNDDNPDNTITVEARPVKPKKEKQNSKIPNSKVPNTKIPNTKELN